MVSRRAAISRPTVTQLLFKIPLPSVKPLRLNQDVVHLLDKRLRKLFQLPRGSRQMRIRGRCLHSAFHTRALCRRLHFWAWSPQMGRRAVESMMTPPPAAVEIGGPRWINALPRSEPVLLTAMAVEHQERWRPLSIQRRSCTNS
jgi:hypothetical protein